MGLLLIQRTLRSNLGALDTGPKINSIVLICLAIPAIMTLRSLCSYGNTYCMQWVSNKVVTDIRGQLFNKMVRSSMDFFNKMRSGLLISRITNETRVVQMALTAVSSDIFKQPVLIVGAISVLFLMDWKFTLITLVLFPTCLVPLRIYGRRARKALRGQFEGMGEMVVTMQETFAGIRVIKSFAREAHQEKEFKRSNQMQFSQMMRIIRSMEATGPLVETIAAVGIGLALLYVYAANLSAGRFFGLISGIFLLYDPIKTLSKLQIVMQQSITATTAIFALLDTEPTVRDSPDATKLTSATGQIDFENVTFRYANTVTDAVSNLTLHIEPGKTYALVGASGAGKSTILSLILRLYDPTSGAVKIDGRDLRSVYAEIIARTDGARHAGDVSVSRHNLQQYPVRSARCDAGRSSRSGASGLCARFYCRPAKGLRNSNWRQRLPSFRWPATASCHRTRCSEERANSFTG